MSKKESVKAMLDMLKALILACLTALFGVFGYSVINYDNLTWVIGIFVTIGVVILVTLLYIFVKQFFKYLDELEKME